MKIKNKGVKLDSSVGCVVTRIFLRNYFIKIECAPFLFGYYIH